MAHVILSEQAERLLGLPPGTGHYDHSDWLTLETCHDEDACARDRAMHIARIGFADRHEVDWRVRQSDGSYRWLRCRIACERDQGGQVTLIGGTLDDVEEEYRLRHDLKRTAERYVFADAAGGGHTDWIIATDEFYGSPRFLELCGLPPDTVFEGRMGFVSKFPFHPEDRQRTVDAMTAHFAGDSVRLEIEMRIVPRGEVRWIHSSGVCTRDENGKLVRWTCMTTDITELKRAELARRASEERFQLAVAASVDGVWDWDIVNDEMFVSERAQRVLGLQPGDTVRGSRQWRDLFDVHPDDKASELHSFDGYVLGDAINYDGEWRVRHPDGIYRWIRVNSLCVRDADSRPLRLAGSISDIDEQKRTEAALRQAQRLEAMGTLAGGIAHDFNNILGAVLGFGEMALADAPEGSRTRRDIECIMTAGERGRALIARILAFSKGSAGERVPVHVEAIVEEALRLIAALSPPHIRIESELSVGRAAVTGNATQCHQIIMNLATNAIQAMQSPGTLRVTLALERFSDHAVLSTGRLAPGEYLVLVVSDSGSGIPTEILDRIFDPFFTTKEFGVGTGLGLSLVHSIVSDLGGAIDVVSQEGAGSTFSVYLPREGDAMPLGKDQLAVLPLGDGERVLIVDDEEPLVTLMCEVLKGLGYVPKGFTSSRAALEAFCAAPEEFDAVITDERMPVMSGLTLIRELRRVESETGAVSAVPILLVSGFLGGGISESAREAGACEVLQKPVTIHDVASMLAKALRGTVPHRTSEIAP